MKMNVQKREIQKKRSNINTILIYIYNFLIKLSLFADEIKNSENQFEEWKNNQYEKFINDFTI